VRHQAGAAQASKLECKKKIGSSATSAAFTAARSAHKQAGGMAGQKSWIVNLDPAIPHAPFPTVLAARHQFPTVPGDNRPIRIDAG